MTADTPPAPRLGANYWRLWAASAVSNVGDGVLLTALPILAARVTDSRVSIGLITTFLSLPWLLLALPAGALLDRFDRRMLMVAADVFRAVLVAVLAVVAAFADVQMWMLWVLAFGLGAGEVFFDSGSHAIIPTIVASEQLERANGMRAAVEVAGNTFIGPPLGAKLITVAAWIPFGIDAVSFVVAAMLITSLTARRSPVAESSEQRGQWRDDVREGMRWARHHSLIRVLIISGVLGNMSFIIYESTFVLFAKEELGVSEEGFGVLMAVIGGGALLAGVVADRVAARLGRRLAMLIGAGGPVLATLAIAAAPVAWWVALMLAVQMVLATIWNIIAMSLRQRLIPNHLFGRVNALFRFFAWGSLPIGAVLGGVLASVAGLRAPYVASAGLMLLAFVLVVTRMRPAAIDAALAAATDDSATTIGTLG
jgi:MFS family permease